MASGKKKQHTGGGQRPSVPASVNLSVVRDDVERLLAPVVADQKASLEEVVVKFAGSRTLVRISVDLPADAIGAMSLDQVSEVARVISSTLDEHDPFAGGYTLEVSTPGTSRPLTLPHHFLRARTRWVVLTLRDGSEAVGRLTAVSSDAAELTVLPAHGAARTVLRSDVVRGRIEVELNRVDEVDLDGPDDLGDEFTTDHLDSHDDEELEH